MANWERIEALRDHLVALKVTKDRKFRMNCLIDIEMANADSYESITKVRKNGPLCKSAGCLAGETLIAFGPSTVKFIMDGADHLGLYSIDVFVSRGQVYGIWSWAEKYLGLKDDEASHMFYGNWTTKNLADITKRDAVKYLNKVLAKKDVMVRI